MKGFLNNKLLKSSLIYTISDSLNKGIPILLMPILINHLSAQEYGILANAIAILRIGSAFIGLNSTSFYSANFYLSDFKAKGEHKQVILTISMVSAIIFALILIASNDFLGKITGLNIDWLLIITLIAFFDVFNILLSTTFRLQQKATSFAVLENTKSLFEICLSLILIIYLNFSYDGRVLSILIITFLISVYSFRKLEISLIKYPSISQIKEVFRFSFPITIHQLAIWIRSGYDRFLLTAMFSASVTGEFTVGYQCGMGLFLLTGAFNKAYNPFLFESLSSPDKNTVKKIKKSIIVYGSVVILSSFFVLSAGYIYLTFFTPQDYNKAIHFFYWVLLGQFFHSFYLISNGFLFFYKKTQVLSRISLVMTILHIGFAYLFSQIFGPLGVVISGSFILFMNALAVSVFAFRTFKAEL